MQSTIDRYTGAPAPAASQHALELGDLPATLTPHHNLLKYYLLASLLTGPFFLFLAVPAWFRYRTLRYEVDDEGITMRWGILFRREVSLTYARIQDIQLTSNVVERWLGLARIQLQTASGSSTAEMTLEGLRQYDALRDFLYGRMRGVRAPQENELRGRAAGALGSQRAADSDELAGLLRDIAAELRALRIQREQKGGAGE